jgi:hypothetical protein
MERQFCNVRDRAASRQAPEQTAGRLARQESNQPTTDVPVIFGWSQQHVARLASEALDLVGHLDSPFLSAKEGYRVKTDIGCQG